MRYLLPLGLLFLAGCATDIFRELPDSPPAPKMDVDVVWGNVYAPLGLDGFTKKNVAVQNQQLVVADKTGRVHKVDLATGKTIWRTRFDTAFSGGPTIHGDFIYLGSHDAEVWKLSLEKGEVVWRKRVSSEVLSSPIIGDHKVIVQTSDGQIQSLRESDGGAVWTYDRSVPLLSVRGTSEPVVVGQSVIAGFASGRVVSLSIRDGKLQWESTVAVPKGRSELERMVDIDGFLAHDADNLYVVSYQGRVAAYTLVSGRNIWARELSSYSGLSLGEQYLFFTDDKGRIWSLDKSSGATLWMQDKLEGLAVTAPAVYSDKLIIGDTKGDLYWLSQADGAILGRVNYRHVS
ncbi:MAG: outer membrane protein assembly factor BamB [Gammaproteobacteria bacterium]|nr:outer membrane protein assembly factor BamB [Gammaproteobacteria bacterium]